MKEVTQTGLGTRPKQADILSIQVEQQMWRGGSFGTKNAAQMLDTVFYYMGKFFGLRLDEQEHLTFGQMSREMNSHGWFTRYRGGKSKTTDGGLRRRKVPFKDVRSFTGYQTLTQHFPTPKNRTHQPKWSSVLQNLSQFTKQPSCHKWALTISGAFINVPCPTAEVS